MRCAAAKLSNNLGGKRLLLSDWARNSVFWLNRQQHRTASLKLSILFISLSRPVSSWTVEAIDASRSKSDYARFFSVEGVGWCSPLTSHRMYLSVCMVEKEEWA
jgi:hypothetical protein